MDDIKQFAKNAKESILYIRICRQNIRLEFDIEKCADNKKQEKTNNSRKRTIN